MNDTATVADVSVDVSVDVYQAALRYHELGLRVIPVAFRDKRPLVAWKKYQEKRPDKSELAKWFKNAERNIGIVCGPPSRGVVVVDFDSADAYRAFEQKVPHICQNTPTVKTARGYHVWLRVLDPVKTIRGNGWEVKGEGGYVLAPPSVHPNGTRYEFINPLNSINDIAVIDNLAEIGIRRRTQRGTQRRIQRRIRPGEDIPQGTRDNTLTSLAGSMHARGMSYNAILSALLIENRERCNPPLDEKQVEKIARSVTSRYPTKTIDIYPNKKALDLPCPEPALREQISAILLGVGRSPIPPANARREEASRLLRPWFKENGGFVQSESGEKFYFFKRSGKLYNLESELWQSFLYALTGANPAGKDYAYIHEDCKAQADLQGEKRRVIRFSAWDDQAKVLRVSRFDGTVYVLDGYSITTEHNGESVLFDDNPLWEPYEPSPNHAQPLTWLTTHLPNWYGNKEMYGLGFRAWIITTFFSELCPTRPLLVLLGEKGSGKSMTLRCLLRLLFGEQAEVAGVPDKPDGFTAAASSSHLMVMDNVDTFTPWLRDKLARLATGGEDAYRRLYTSNDVGIVRYRCWLALTARTPDTLRRDDLADRLLLLPVQRIESKDLTPERMLLKLCKETRNEFWGHMFAVLNNVVREIRAGNLKNQSSLRMADWESLGRLVAYSENNSETWEKFVTHLKSAQVDFLLEDDLLVEGLSLWLQNPQNRGRWVSARELYPELTSLLFNGKVPQADWPQSAKGMGKKLSNLWRDLGYYFHVERSECTQRQNKGAKLFRFLQKSN